MQGRHMMDIKKLCRVCLSECEELTPLWRELPGENKTLKEAINFIVNINIKFEDGLPDKICNICESVLDLADTFKQRCLESESILEQQAQQKQNDKTLLKCKKNVQKNIEINSEDTFCLPTSISQTSLKDSLSVMTESAVNIYDLPEHKIKMEIEEHHVDAGSEQENFSTRVDEIPKEQCFIKEEFSAETIKHFDNKKIFSCPHCNLAFQTKISYKAHIFCVHSSFSHSKDAPSLKKPKFDDMQPTTAEVRSATEDPAAADTSTATVIGTERDFVKAKKTGTNGKKKKQKLVRKINKDKMKKESTKDTAAVLKLSGTNTDDKVTCATEKQSECFNSTVIGTTGDIHTCDICGYTAATVKSLNSHLKAHAATKRYACDTCSYITSKLNNFNDHVRSHTGDKPYSCQVCKKQFSIKNVLVRHVRTHTGEKPYTCSVCEEKFIQKHHLVSHVRKTHTGEKPYSCDLCAKKFILKHNFASHVKKHKGERPYSCDVCKKKFNVKSCLVQHVRTHAGDKPYTCEVCEKKFTQKRYADAHLKTHTGEKPYSCDVCVKKFGQKGHLVRHTRTHRHSLKAIAGPRHSTIPTALST